MLKNTTNFKTKQKSDRCIGVGQNEWNWKVVRLQINVLNFKKKEDFNKLMEQIRPIIMLCVNSLVIKIPINSTHGKKMTLKQIVL